MDRGHNMPSWNDVPDEIKKRFPAPPERQKFNSSDEYEEALGYWQSRVGRNLGMVMQQHMASQNRSVEEVKTPNPEGSSSRTVKSSFSSGGRTFVTYANDWDLHKGSRPWGDLSPNEQNQFLREQFSNSGTSQWTQAIRSDLLKSHANGWRTLIVYLFLALKNGGFIQAGDSPSESNAHDLSEALDGLKIGKRLSEYRDSDAEQITKVRNSDIELLSKLDDLNAPLDDYHEFKRFLEGNLETCDSYAESPRAYADDASEIIESMNKRQSEAAAAAAATKVTDHAVRGVVAESKRVRFWRSLFPPLEVRLAIKSIRQVVSSYSGSSIGPLGKDRLLKRVQAAAVSLARSPETELAMGQEHVHHSDLALVYVACAAADSVACGDYHVYRGLLTDDGRYLVSLVNYALGELQKSGHYSADEVVQAKARVQASINRAG